MLSNRRGAGDFLTPPAPNASMPVAPEPSSQAAPAPARRMPSQAREQQESAVADAKLIGQNYITPDQIAKVTGRAKYAEDYRAEGMLFAKQLLSTMPHARVTRIDASAALAMPGVKAMIAADPHNERALTMEPVYEGEPILAIAAVDELTAAEALEKIVIEYEPLPFVVDPLDSLRPGGPNARTDGNVWVPKPGDKNTGPFA